MEKKEVYEVLVFDVITFDNVDVITDSNYPNGLPNEDV